MATTHERLTHTMPGEDYLLDTDDMTRQQDIEPAIAPPEVMLDNPIDVPAAADHLVPRRPVRRLGAILALAASACSTTTHPSRTPTTPAPRSASIVNIDPMAASREYPAIPAALIDEGSLAAANQIIIRPFVNGNPSYALAPEAHASGVLIEGGKVELTAAHVAAFTGTQCAGNFIKTPQGEFSIDRQSPAQQMPSALQLGYNGGHDLAAQELDPRKPLPVHSLNDSLIPKDDSHPAPGSVLFVASYQPVTETQTGADGVLGGRRRPGAPGMAGEPAVFPLTVIGEKEGYQVAIEGVAPGYAEYGDTNMLRHGSSGSPVYLPNGSLDGLISAAPAPGKSSELRSDRMLLSEYHVQLPQGEYATVYIEPVTSALVNEFVATAQSNTNCTATPPID